MHDFHFFFEKFYRREHTGCFCLTLIVFRRHFNHHECQLVVFLFLKLSMAKTNRDNLCEAKVGELVNLSHIDFVDYHVVMHALLSNVTFL